jgi:DNA-binding XRE family transcriptional regulator/tetratricopeptide (TPR) repeat protein
MSESKIPNRKLKQERERRGWSQQKLAELVGTSFENISRWERGITSPQPHFREKLCELFGKDTALLGFIEESLEIPEPFPIPTSPAVSTDMSDRPPRANKGASMMVDEPGQPDAYSVMGPLHTATSELRIPMVVRPAHQAVDLMSYARKSSPEQQLGAWLALVAGDLVYLCEEGWTPEEVFTSLHLILKVVQIMSKITRRRLLELGATALVSGIAIPIGKHISAEERTELHSALSESIQAGWKLFVTASMPQVLAVGQAQLQLLHQAHADLYSSMRPLFYSPVYRLIGAALFFQSRYAEAMQAHTQAYLTALEAGDAWNMAESLSWQAGILKASGRQAESIQTTEAALRLLESSHEAHVLASRARLFAHWAESAALLGKRHMMEEKLAASADLLTQCEGNDEFDVAIWQLYHGTCALYIGDSIRADIHLEQALHELRPNLLHQRASAGLLLARARLNRRDMKGSLETVHDAVPLVVAAASPLLSRGLMDLVEQLATTFPMQTEVRDLTEEVAHHPRLCAFQAREHVPRYLEATL